jgi:hypothetical protein
MKNRIDLRKSALALAMAAVVTVAVPAPAAALEGEGSLWGGIWGWLGDVWESAVAATPLEGLCGDQGAGLDPNG